MRTYILKYKYDNLVHILLLALNSAIFVSASVTLALMTNQLVSKRIQSFLALLGLELGLYVIYLVLNSNYIHCTSKRPRSVLKFTGSMAAGANHYAWKKLHAHPAAG